MQRNRNYHLLGDQSDYYFSGLAVRHLAARYPHGQPVFEHFWTSVLFPAEVADRQSISVSDLPAVAGEAEAFLELPFPAAAAYRTYIFIYSRRGAWVETWHYP